jgi:hypothetical protein
MAFTNWNQNPYPAALAALSLSTPQFAIRAEGGFLSASCIDA